MGGLDPDAVGALLELIGDDPEALAELVDAFLDEGPARLAELRAGADAGDAALVVRAAHTLKANAGTFGAAALQLLSQEVEKAAREGDLGPARRRIDALEEAWAGIRPALETLRDGGTAA